MRNASTGMARSNPLIFTAINPAMALRETAMPSAIPITMARAMEIPQIWRYSSVDLRK
jgi:hypothetical protein